MATYVLKDCKIWVAEYNLSGDHNQIALKHSAREIERNTFGSASVRRLAGLEDVELSGQAVSDYADDDVNEALFGRIGAAGKPITVAPEDGADGAVAYFFEGLHFELSEGGSVGELHNVEHTAKGRSRLVKGTILEPGAAARTSTFNGTARNVGAVSATQKLYAALHVFAASGSSPTLDVKVQSDSASGFTTPADQITFTQATARTSQFAAPVAGAITDSWWRIAATIGGSAPSFTFAVVIGIR